MIDVYKFLIFFIQFCDKISGQGRFRMFTEFSKENGLYHNGKQYTYFCYRMYKGSYE